MTETLSVSRLATNNLPPTNRIDSGAVPTRIVFVTAGAPLYRAQGCASCRNTGYRGRAGLFELLLVTDAMRKGIVEGCDGSALQELAVADGMVTLHEDGLRKVSQGLTTYEEVLRATESEDNG